LFLVEVTIGAIVVFSVLTFVLGDSLIYSQTIGTASVMIEVQCEYLFRINRDRLVWDYLNCFQIEEIKAQLG